MVVAIGLNDVRLAVLSNLQVYKAYLIAFWLNLLQILKTIEENVLKSKSNLPICSVEIL